MVFDLTDENFVRRDSTRIQVKGANMNVEYNLHKEEFPNPKDPAGNPVDMWCIYVPQIMTAYTDRSEELCFEAMYEFFEEDFVRYFATKLLEEREKVAK
jgi:hypothetical protein